MSTPPQKDGLACRKCGGMEFTVVYTRHHHGCIVRNRKCKNCGKRMLTRERPAGKA